MNRLSPLLELRGQWREAAAVTAPAAAAELVDVLDRVLDLLQTHGQLDEGGLTMAIDTVCNAYKGRPDEVELLRHRLRRAAHDYTQTTAADSGLMEASGEAFTSEQALAEALFGMGSGTMEISDQATTAAPAPAAAPRLDEKDLRKSLRSGRRKRRAWVSLLPIVILVAIIGGALYYFIQHPPTVVVTPGTGPTTSTAPSTLGGSFSGTTATCSGGVVQGDACRFDATLSGAATLTVSWIPGDARVSLTVRDSSGAPVAPPVIGTGGKVSFTTPKLASGTYSVIVAPASPPVAGTVQFQLASG